MLVLSADSLVFQMQKLLIRVVMFVMELDRFGLMMLIVEVMSHLYFHADIEDGEFTIVLIAKTRVFDVEVSPVRIYI